MPESLTNHLSNIGSKLIRVIVSEILSLIEYRKTVERYGVWESGANPVLTTPFGCRYATIETKESLFTHQPLKLADLIIRLILNEKRYVLDALLELLRHS